MAGGTKRRGARIRDDIWGPALAKAKRRGITLTSVIERGLLEFLDEPEPGQDPEIPGQPPQSP